MKSTTHYTESKRRVFIDKYIGRGHIIQIVVVDKGHKDGAEFHVLTSTGIIKVYNYITHKHITDLIARPNQIKRDFDEWTWQTIAYAVRHQRLGWNKG